VTDHLLIVAGVLVAGYILLALELFVVPGFGVPGVGGLLSLAAGCILSVYWFGAYKGGVTVLLVLGLTSGLLIWFPHSRYGRAFIHKKSLADAHASGRSVEVGTGGVAESDLRPSGIVRFGSVRESAVADGEYIAAGTPVVVTQASGSRLVVEKVEAAASDD
jgi:membrane-bound serine protease (ClpP class)